MDFLRLLNVWTPFGSESSLPPLLLTDLDGTPVAEDSDPFGGLDGFMVDEIADPFGGLDGQPIAEDADPFGIDPDLAESVPQWAAQ